MGKSQIIGKHQRQLLDAISRVDFLAKTFYFTGGTALAVFYLKHRVSVDLDFFSETEFEYDLVWRCMSDLKRKLGFDFTSRIVGSLQIFELKFKDGQDLKIDFSHYPYKRLERSKKMVNKMPVDSLFDIAVNKLMTIVQRHTVKDFVDLYFLMPKYGFWVLRDSAMKKFEMEIDPYFVAATFMEASEYPNLPEMIKPIKEKQLVEFYYSQGKKLAGKMVE